jgi:GNAT superfamily N-acetyltransferase
MILLERPLDLPTVPVTARVPLEVRMPVRTMSQEYLDFRKDTRATTVRRRLEAGHWYATAHFEGRLVYVRWIGIGDSYEYYIGCNFNMSPEEVYAYDLFVAPDLRGQNIATSVANQVYQYLHGAGYRRMITTIIPETKASLRVSEKLGNIIIGKAGYYKLGPWKKIFCRTVPGSVPPKLSLATTNTEE